MRLPRISLVLVAVAGLAAPSTASAYHFGLAAITPQQLQHEQRIVKLRTQVLHWRRKAVALSIQVGPKQEVHGPVTTRSIPFLRWLRRDWKHRYHEFVVLQQQQQRQAATPTTSTSTAAPTASYGGSLISAFNCISLHEEYGVTGQNTSAGYFGMIYPPSAYPSPGPEYAAQYGDSWLDIPLSAQYQIAIAEQARYGWSPWSTAPACGL